MASADATNWCNTPLVVVERARCPFCASLAYPIITKTEDQGDESIMRKLICRDCSRRWRLVLEPLPVAGNRTLGQPDTGNNLEDELYDE